ncbi:MAG: diphthine--ammonia ligase [bacterium]|nr:diphthine--ammonia ligase [bacterium]
MQVFVSWSGGKDSCLALYTATLSGLKVLHLLNILSEDGERSRSHGLSSSLIDLQSDVVGIPIIQRKATWEGYEQEFKAAIKRLKQVGIRGGVFGDISLQPHRDWVEEVCQELGIHPYLPLWGRGEEEILRDFIEVGFEAIVVTTRADILGKDWLGRRIDMDFVHDLKEVFKYRSKDIPFCGESGEYHTFVTYGPLFKSRIKILKTRKVLRDNHWFLDPLSYTIED